MLKKQLLKINIFLTMAFSSINIFNFAQAEQISMEATVTADVLTVRQEPKTDSAVLTSLKKGTKVTIIGSNDNKDWYQIFIQDKKGWISQKFTQINIIGNINYNTVSTIGTTKEQGILNNSLKIAVVNNSKYVLDSSDKHRLNVYDNNNKFISSRELNYPWVNNKSDENYIVFAVDEEENLYTNSIARNTITIFDPTGLKTGEIKAELLGDVSFIEYDSTEKLLYSLDNSSKTIKVFDKKGANIRNIFLSETTTPKSFTVNKGRVYVVDYPENGSDYTQVYYVNSYSFSLKNNYDPKATVVENLSKGSILKYNPGAKIIKSKTLINDDPGKVKELSWIDFSENERKKYADAEELKKVNTLGEIDVYKTSGEPQNKITFNKKWILASPDRHKAFNENEIIRQMLGVIVDKDGTVIVPVLSKIKNVNTASLNYYYFNISNDSYKVSQPLPFNDNNSLTFSVSNKNIYSLNGRGYITILNENGIENGIIGRINPTKFNLPDKLYLNNNKLYVFDRGNYSFGEYDLNGEALRVRRIDQGGDLFKWSDVFYANETILMAKTLDVEEKKLGLEIYDLNFKKLFDKWLMSIDTNTVPKVARNEKNEIFIAGKGSFYGKKSFLAMLNNKGHLINRWLQETDIINLFPEASYRNIKANTLKLVGFDTQGNVYIFNVLVSNKSRISKVKINTDGRGEVLMNFDGKFFDDTKVIEPDKEKIENSIINNSFNGEILDIKMGKNGFTYFLYKDKKTNISRLGLFDPTGNFWKEFSFSNFGSVPGFALDSQDNIWITEGSGIKKLATYK